MRIVKLALLSFFIFFFVLLVVTFLIPSNIHMSKVVTIKADKDSIFSLIKNKEQWPRWHPAFPKNDPTQIQQVMSAVKAVVVSESDSVLQMQWQFKTSEPLRNQWQLYTVPSEGSTVLQWSMNFHLSWYPWKKLESLFFEARYGKMMEQGLNNLKQELQK